MEAVTFVSPPIGPAISSDGVLEPTGRTQPPEVTSWIKNNLHCPENYPILYIPAAALSMRLEPYSS